MDSRITQHAETLVDWSARVEAGDEVVVRVDEGVHDLAVAVARALGKRNAKLLAVYESDELERAYLDAFENEFEASQPEQALYEQADVVLRLSGTWNTAGQADVPGERRADYRRARQQLRETRMNTDWVSTLHPTRALAQQAGMAYAEYQEFVYNAVLRDWETLADEMETLKQVLDAGSEVRIETPGTDLRMSIENRTAVNSAASVAYDSHNLPSGEVFTAPFDTTGHVTFDVPATVDGTRVSDVRVTFTDGEVTDVAAETGESVIRELLDTDAGARRLGELGIGMNRGIDRFTDNILFDEKMGDTVHLAVGRAYDACLPDGKSGNDSAVHQDLIADMSTDSRLLVDGEVVQRNGRFRWEDGFED